MSDHSAAGVRDPSSPGGPSPRRSRRTAAPQPSFRGGAGEPLLLVHAGWTSWEMWKPFVAALGGRRDVIAPTLPGHIGGPELPFVVDPGPGRERFDVLVDALERHLDDHGVHEPIDVVGNSIGGWAALELARRGRARRVVAIGPMGMHDAAQGRALERRFRPRHRLARLSRPLAAAALSVPAIRRVALQDLVVDAGRLDAQFATRIAEAFTWADVPALFDAARAPDGSLDRIVRADEIDTPVLLLWGDRDTIADRTQMDRYLAALPDAELQVLHGAGHCPQLDDPAGVARAVSAFLQAG
ncbi:alpha/beta fold hydrolase [Patulibacter sp.]|uniref:alpha/beta fold hydrolase n=1 Tax=Patulibacter sp. TaxID=1912859 RepID=UPI00271FB485|nr:alpha/beta hydrolase [Patulibacter sp.]MDO9406947.1 alpha/beta hydrolase [Patulibacter sp.]